MSQNIEEIKEAILAVETSSHTDVKDFVQDNFFEKGYLWLKIRQIFVNFIFFLALVIPIILMINSIDKGKLWNKLHHWIDERQGLNLTYYLESTILFIIVVILVSSLGLLFWNNYRELNVYSKKKTYDENKLEARKELLNEMYAKRFGGKDIRENARYYEVDGEQNLPDDMISNMFKEAGVEIK